MPPEPAAFVTLTLLTLNLHTWQEPDQLAKFARIAEFIIANRVDIVCFQECAQHRDSALIPGGAALREDNAAVLIMERLGGERGSWHGPAWDWAHYGWDVWEEGVAVIARHPIRGSGSRWLSTSQSRTDHAASRKAMRARIDLPGAGPIDVYSAHLSWESAGLVEQVDALNRWIAETETGARAVIVAGDFNDGPLGRGSAAMRAAGFEDAATVVDTASMRLPTTTWGTHIDYVYFRNRVPMLLPEEARIVFAGDSEPIVSDHFGVLTRFRLAPR